MGRNFIVHGFNKYPDYTDIYVTLVIINFEYISL